MVVRALVPHFPPPRRPGYNAGMSGEEFIAVLGVGFAAFLVWLAVQIVNRERWAISIAVAIGAAALVILAIFVHIIRMSIEA